MVRFEIPCVVEARKLEYDGPASGSGSEVEPDVFEDDAGW